MPGRTRKSRQNFALKVDARKMRQRGTAADAAAFSPLAGHEVPPDLSLLPDWETLFQTSLSQTSASHEAAACRTTDGLGSYRWVDFGAGSTTGSGSWDCEETEPEVEDFQRNADAAMRTLSSQAIDFCKMIRSPVMPLVTVEASSPLAGHEVPPGLSLPDCFTPPLCVAPPPGLECSNSSEAATCRTADGLGRYRWVNFGAGSTTGSGLWDCEETEPDVEEFQRNADAAMCTLSSQAIEFCKMIRSPVMPLVTVGCPDTGISWNADAPPFVPSFLSEALQTKPEANKVHWNENASCIMPGQLEVPGRRGAFLALARSERGLCSKQKTPNQNPFRKVVVEDTYSTSPSK